MEIKTADENKFYVTAWDIFVFKLMGFVLGAVAMFVFLYVLAEINIERLENGRKNHVSTEFKQISR